MGKANATDVSNRYCLKAIGCSRLTVPPNCSTPFWDPIGGKCLCSATSCNFNDDSRPIGVRILFSLYLLVRPNCEKYVLISCFFLFVSPFLQPNGANLTGGGTGSAFYPSGSSPQASYIPFNGAAPPSILPAGSWPALLLGCIGAFMGTFGVFSRL